MKEKIEQQITNTIETVYSQPQDTIDNLETAAAILSLGLYDSRILCFSSPCCNYLSSMFCSQINNNYAQKTNRLHAININTNNNESNYIPVTQSTYNSMLLQFELIKKEGDILFLITSNENESKELVKLIEYAQNNLIPIIIIAHHKDNIIKNIVSENDIPLYVATNNQFTFFSVAHLIISVLLSVLTDDEIL